MKAIKQLLRPERLRQVPEQFSWVDQALVQRHFIDRCEARSAALYLFLITVSDAQGLSYYGAPTLAQRLHLSDEQFAAARQQLIELELIAYRSPLYQVLALPGSAAARRPAPRTQAAAGGQPVSLATLLQQAQQRRG
ncbi:MAG: hypothetical protein ABL916_13390 [Burkholderiaceae bacterium]